MKQTHWPSVQHKRKEKEMEKKEEKREERVRKRNTVKNIINEWKKHFTCDVNLGYVDLLHFNAKVVSSESIFSHCSTFYVTKGFKVKLNPSITIPPIISF